MFGLVVKLSYAGTIQAMLNMKALTGLVCCLALLTGLAQAADPERLRGNPDFSARMLAAAPVATGDALFDYRKTPEDLEREAAYAAMLTQLENKQITLDEAVKLQGQIDVPSPAPSAAEQR